MWVRNTTDFPTEVVREIIAFVRPQGIGGFDVRVSNCSWGPGCGKAYTRGCWLHERACPFIVVRVTREDVKARHRWSAGKGYLPKVTGSREEVLVMILAHELRHLWQKRFPSGRRVWGARGQFSERDADAWALQKLRAWRRRCPPEPSSQARLVLAGMGSTLDATQQS